MRSFGRRANLLRGARMFWKKFATHRGGLIGLAIVCLLSIVALFAPYIAPYSYINTNAGPSLAPPSLTNLFGTDQIGRDVFSTVVLGSQVSLSIGIAASIISTLFGALIGAISGYYRGVVDEILMRFTELVMVIPTLVVAIVVLTFFGPSIYNLIFIISAVLWPGTARSVRAEFTRLRDTEFVESARATGAGDMHIIFREILPNTYGVLIVNAMLVVAFAILLAAGLGFVGLGNPNVPDWGAMLYNAVIYSSRAWWLAVFPGVAIFITAMGFNLFGDGLTYAINPKLR